MFVMVAKILNYFKKKSKTSSMHWLFYEIRRVFIINTKIDGVFSVYSMNS